MYDCKLEKEIKRIMRNLREHIRVVEVAWRGHSVSTCFIGGGVKPLGELPGGGISCDVARQC